jgi:DNA modification methylase
VSVEIRQGDCLEVLRTMPDESVHCCVTSPPYWGLRDYGTATWEGGDAECNHVERSAADCHKSSTLGPNRDGLKPTNAAFKALERQFQEVCGKCGAKRIDMQLGLEPTPEEYIARMVAVFREVKRVLRADATCWVNMGDSYNGSRGGEQGESGQMADRSVAAARCRVRGWTLDAGLKPKDLCGIPWMLAFALRTDGWYLRSDIIWAKPNPMPESVTDRPTKSHEYLFLLSKSERYYYDADAIAEKSIYAGDLKWQGEKSLSRGQAAGANVKASGNALKEQVPVTEMRNKRSVWTVATQPTPDAHFATFPEELIKPCILAGCPAGGTVLDPFFGSGTTGLVARMNGCNAIGIELNAAYIEIAKKRLSQEVFEFGK